MRVRNRLSIDSKRKRKREEGSERQCSEYNLNNTAFLRSNRTVQSDSNDPFSLSLSLSVSTSVSACARDNCSNQIHADCVGDAIKILFAQSAWRACGHSNRSHLFAGKRNVCLYWSHTSFMAVCIFFTSNYYYYYNITRYQIFLLLLNRARIPRFNDSLIIFSSICCYTKSEYFNCLDLFSFSFNILIYRKYSRKRYN